MYDLLYDPISNVKDRKYIYIYDKISFVNVVPLFRYFLNYDFI